MIHENVLTLTKLLPSDTLDVKSAFNLDESSRENDLNRNYLTETLNQPVRFILYWPKLFHSLVCLVDISRWLVALTKHAPLISLNKSIIKQLAYRFNAFIKVIHVMSL